LRSVVPGLERILDTLIPAKLRSEASLDLQQVAPPPLPSSSATLMKLLPASAAASSRLATVTARLGFDLLLAPVALALRGVRHLPQWSAAGGAEGQHHAPASSHGDDEGLDAYSLQPSAYATAIGDAAMRLVQVCGRRSAV
jgi:hypothetical protein